MKLIQKLMVYGFVLLNTKGDLTIFQQVPRKVYDLRKYKTFEYNEFANKYKS